jgi:hypothetical protein
MKADRKPDIAMVAASIAQGPLPEWLIPSLEHFQAGLTDHGPMEPEFFHSWLKRMLAAIDALEKGLPVLLLMPLSRNKDAWIAYGSLPGVKRDLEAALRSMRQPGRKPNISEEICVAVVAECWKLIHKKAPRHSDRFREACDDCWQAWGHKSKGDLANWRRIIERALAVDHAWIRSQILAIVHNSQ